MNVWLCQVNLILRRKSQQENQTWDLLTVFREFKADFIHLENFKALLVISISPTVIIIY